MISRRSLLVGLSAGLALMSAPAIVARASIMSVKPIVTMPHWWLAEYDEVTQSFIASAFDSKSVERVMRLGPYCMQGNLRHGGYRRLTEMQQIELDRQLPRGFDHNVDWVRAVVPSEWVEQKSNS